MVKNLSSTPVSWLPIFIAMSLFLFFQKYSKGLGKEFLVKIARVSSITRRRQWHPTPVLLPGKSHGWRNLVGCSPRGHWGSNTTEWLHFHFSLSFIGEENGNLLQCSCLENPRDRGAWWAAVYGVPQSRTRLKRFSSSSSNICLTSVFLTTNSMGP